MYSSDAHTNVYKGSIAVWRGVGKSARGGRAGGCFVVGRTSEGKTWWPLVAAFIRGGTLRTFSDLSSLFSPLSFSSPRPLFSFSPLSPRSFTCVHDDSTTKRGGGEGGFVRREKKKKNFSPLRIIRDKKGTFFVGFFHLIFHDAGGRKKKKNLPPVFTPTFGYLETHYRAPLRGHGLRTFLKSYTISRIRAR